MAMSREYGSAGLGPSKNVPRIKNRPLTKRPTKKPSDLMRERQAKRESETTLGERLSEASMAVPPGEGMAGKAVKAGIGGAATGATIGEALAKLHQERIQRGQPRKPTAVSEMSMSGGKDERRKRRQLG